MRRPLKGMASGCATGRSRAAGIFFSQEWDLPVIIHVISTRNMEVLEWKKNALTFFSPKKQRIEMALIRQCSTAAFQSDTPISNHSHKPSARAGTATMLYHDYHVIVNLHSEQYSELGRVLETDDFVEIT